MKKAIGLKRILSYAVLLGCVIGIFSFYQPILIGAGRYLSPEGMKKAEVVILEGTELIRENAVRVGLGLIRAGVADQLVLVYQRSEDERIFGRPSNYTIYLTKELEKLGLKKDQIIVLEVPKEHPVTLTEARIVLSDLSKSGVKSAILVVEGFHTRRSLWVYRKIGLLLGIEIIPHPYFMRYENKNWWRQVYGAREFFEEGLKFFYYLFCGYIPLKSILVA